MDVGISLIFGEKHLIAEKLREKKKKKEDMVSEPCLVLMPFDVLPRSQVLVSKLSPLHIFGRWSKYLL